MAKSAKSKPSKTAAAAAIQITQDCERGSDGYGALDFVHHIPKRKAIERAQVSACKAMLLAAGFESLEVTAYADGQCDNWDPRCDGGVDLVPEDGWRLVAVLKVADDEAEQEIVALFARPAGLVDAVPEDKPWPFPKTAGGGPDASSEVEKSEVVPAPAPAMSMSDAHLQRKASQFEILEPTDALLRTFTPRVEKHGEDDVSAASLGLTIEAPNTILDLLSPSLRPTLYAAPEGQASLPGVEESTPLLRTKVIEKLQLKNAYKGWTLCITAGVDSDITIGDCKVDKFVVTPQDGGSVQLDLRIGSSDIDEAEAGWLYGHLRQHLEITLHAPKPKPEAIDGTVGHPGAAAAAADDGAGGDELTAGDLFAAAHGGDDDGGDDELEEEPSC